MYMLRFILYCDIESHAYSPGSACTQGFSLVPYVTRLDSRFLSLMYATYRMAPLWVPMQTNIKPNVFL